jgi:ABC-type ATPase involved in cell division
MITLENVERSYQTGAGQTGVLGRISLRIGAREFINVRGASRVRDTAGPGLNQATEVKA